MSSTPCIGGLQAFVPMDVQQVREGRRRRPRTIRTVMMPGYVLAKMPHGYAARHVPIVRGIVCMDGEPGVSGAEPRTSIFLTDGIEAALTRERGCRRPPFGDISTPGLSITSTSW